MKIKRIAVLVIMIVAVIACVGCKKTTNCDLCFEKTKCRYYDDMYLCDDCYKTVKEWEKMDEEYNND